jgi:hypothetical protein
VVFSAGSVYFFFIVIGIIAAVDFVKDKYKREAGDNYGN